MWFPLKDACEALGIDAQFQEVALRCTIKKTGAQIRLVGADDMREIEKLRGQSFHEVQIDEAASYPRKLLEALLFRIIGPRLGDLDGVITMFGTPGHILSGPFYDATKPGAETHWSVHHWTLEDAAKHVAAMARLWKEAQVEKADNGWSDDNPIWMREYLGRWAADDTTHMFRYRAHVDGKPWNQWDPERVGPFKFAKLPDGVDDWLFGYGMDPGVRDPMSLNVFAISPSDPEREILHCFGFDRRGMHARPIAELLVGEEAVQRMLRGDGLPDKVGGLFGITGWPAKAVTDTAGLAEMLINELAKVYGIRFEAAKKADKHGSIEVTNGQLVDGKLKILKGSVLEDQLMELQWKPDEHGQPKEDKGARNDAADSCLYVVPEMISLFDARAPRGSYAGSSEARTPEPEPIPDSEYSWLMSEGHYGDL